MTRERVAIAAAAAIAVVATAVVIAPMNRTTYAGASPYLLATEVTGAAAWLVLALLGTGPAAVAALVGAVWMVPELAGWVGGPGAVRTLAAGADALLPAAVVASVIAPPTAWRRRLGAALLGGALLAAIARVLLVDPFLDASCWRWCDHNPLAVPGAHSVGAGLHAAGVLVAASASACWVAAGSTATGGVRRNAMGILVVTAVTAPALLRFGWLESASSVPYLACVVGAQAGAVGLAVQAGARWWSRRSLMRRTETLIARLRTTPAPGAVAEALRAAVGDASLQVGYWSPSRNRYVEENGGTAPTTAADGRRSTAVVRDGRPVALLRHAPSTDSTALGQALRPALRLALENEALRAAATVELDELRLSRARLVARADVERRRLERNLHDGAQQRAVALALFVRVIGEQVTDPRGRAVTQAVAELAGEVVTELRAVARGIYPAVLADTGLADALGELAASEPGPLVTMDMAVPGRYTRIVESTAFQVAAACVAEAGRHGAAAVRITGRVLDGVVGLRMDDDAGGERPAVTELADQVQALGGRLRLMSREPGTTVELELPCVW